MKWILIAILILVVMIIAKAIAQQYIDKFEFYNNLKEFIQQLKINISFKKEKIFTFIEKINAKKQFLIFINEYKNYLKNGNLNLNEIKILENEEKNDLIDIIKNIGKYNSENEINQINNFLITINMKLQKAQEDKNKVCPIIIKLSLLFSIGLAILLI